MRKGIIGASVSFLFAVVMLGTMIWDAQENSHSMMIEANTLGSFIDEQRQDARVSFYELNN